jgi:hypothetical protein
VLEEAGDAAEEEIGAGGALATSSGRRRCACGEERRSGVGRGRAWAPFIVGRGEGRLRRWRRGRW